MDDPNPSSLTATIRDQKATMTRLRIAYMYYVESMTQSDIAERLGIGRVTVVRHLTEARANREVRFWIEGALSDCAALEVRLERVLGLTRAVVSPAAADPRNTARLIGFNAGIHVSELLSDGMRIGLGWGRTLHHALDTLSRPGLRDMSVVSLLGGVQHARAHNPAEFAWRVASAIDADCHLFTTPALVDSAETRAALFERCGLGRIVERARDLDLALVGVGSVAPTSTALSCAREMIGRDIGPELLAAGAVGDLFFNYFNAEGALVDHPVNARVMSAPLSVVRTAHRRVIAAGGAEKVEAIIAACRMLTATALITDETTAAMILARVAPPPGAGNDQTEHPS